MTLKEKIVHVLGELKCPENHNTGLGCCRCTKNDAIEEILELLDRFEDECLENGYA